MRCTLSQVYFGKQLYTFRTNLLYIIRSLNTVYTAIGICHASYVDCLLVRSGWNLECCILTSPAECQTTASCPRIPCCSCILFFFVLCFMIGQCHLTEQMLVLKVYQSELFLRDCENLMMKGNYQANSNCRVLLYLPPPFALLPLLWHRLLTL